MRHRAGEQVDVVITYLAMEARPGYPRPHLPTGPASALIGAERPPVWYFLGLYDAVGRAYEWTDKHDGPDGRARRLPARPRGHASTPSCAPAGRTASSCSTAARPSAATSPISASCPRRSAAASARFLLQTAVHMAWDRPGTRQVTVNTNTLDHPRALPLYQKAGFAPVRRETRTRVLTRDRDTIDA